MEAPWVFIPYGIDVHPKESTMSLLVSRLNYVPINFPEIMPHIRSGSVCLNFNNWAIQFDSVEKKPVETAHPTRLPTADDYLCATRELSFNLNGASLA